MKKTTDFVVSGYIFYKNKVLLVYHKKLKKWLPPGGHIEKNEIPEKALVREILEETGLKVSIIGQTEGEERWESVNLLIKPNHLQLEKINSNHFHIDLVYLCQIEELKKVKNNCRFFTEEELSQEKNVPKEVVFFAKKLLKKNFNIFEKKLPITSYFAKKEKRVDFSKVNLFLIQHIKKNTIEFIRILKKRGFKQINIVGKNYSIDQQAEEEIKAMANLVLPDFKSLENLSVIKALFDKYLDNNNFICLDLGGYFSKFFQRVNKNKKLEKQLLGIIEDTKNGIWFNKEDEKKFKIPLLSVASSHLKDYGENYFVAKAIYRNFENILIEGLINQSVAYKKILVLGYGKIGRRLADFLKKENQVWIYDINPVRMFEARIDGLNVLKDLNEISKFDIVFGITGDIVLKKNHLIKLKNGAFLVNGSTRQREFDIKALRDEAFETNRINQLEEFVFRDGRSIYLVNSGYPVNFYQTESLPDFIIDLVFSEIYLLVELLMEKKLPPGYYPIEKSFPEIEDLVVKKWLDYWVH